MANRWAEIAGQNAALLTQAIEKLGTAERQIVALEQELSVKRTLLRDIYLCRLARGNGTICRSCWERAERQRLDHTALVWSAS